MPTREEYLQQAEEARQRVAASKELWSPSESASEFFGGVTDSVLGPARKIISSAILSRDELEYQKQREQEHQMARMAGSIAGYAAGALTGTGLGGLLTGASRAATGAVAKRLGVEAVEEGAKRSWGQLGARTVASAAGTGLEGGGIALSEATGEAAIDRALGIPGAGIQIADSVGSGMQFGMIAGALGTLLPSTANWLFRKGFGKRIEKMADARGKQDVARQKLNALEAKLQSVWDASIDGEERALRLRMILGDPKGQFIRQGTGIAEGVPLRTLDMGREPIMVKALREMDRGDQAVRDALNASIDEFGNSTRNAVADAATSAIALAKGGPMGWLFHKIFSPSISMMQQMVYKGIMHTPGARFAMSSSLTAGRLSVRKWSMQGGKLVRLPVRYDPFVDVSRETLRALKVPPVQYLTDKEFREVTNEINSLDPAAMEMTIRAGLAAKGVPQAAATSVVKGYLNTLNYVKNQAPQRHQPKWIVDEGEPVIKSRDKVSFSRTLRSAMMPTSVLADFLNGDLTREAADAWWNTQPEWAKLYAEEIARNVDIASAYGRVFTPKEKEQIGLMTDPSGQLLGRTKDYNLIQYLQSTYQAEQVKIPPAQLGGPKPPGDPKAAMGLGQTVMGPSASLGQRLAKR